MGSVALRGEIVMDDFLWTQARDVFAAGVLDPKNAPPEAWPRAPVAGIGFAQGDTPQGKVQRHGIDGRGVAAGAMVRHHHHDHRLAASAAMAPLNCSKLGPGVPSLNVTTRVQTSRMNA